MRVRRPALKARWASAQQSDGVRPSIVATGAPGHPVHCILFIGSSCLARACRMCHVGRVIRARVSLILAVFVAIGLVSVPVECTVADGPHSIFADARSVAALQDGSGGRASSAHGHDHHASATGGTDAADRDNGASASGSGIQPDPAAGDADAAPPQPAGFASDAISAASLPFLDDTLAALGPLVRIPTDALVLPGELLRSPEPPPP